MSTPSEPRGPSAGAPGDESPRAHAEQVAAVHGGRPSTATAPRVARRPAEAWAGAIFLTLAALPAVAMGVVLGLQPGPINANLRERIEAANSTASTDFVLTVFRAAGVAILILGLLFILFAWLTVAPKKGARAVVSALAAFEVVMLLAGMVVAGLDPVSLGIVLLAVAGTVLLYLPRTNEYLISNW